MSVGKSTLDVVHTFNNNLQGNHGYIEWYFFTILECKNLINNFTIFSFVKIIDKKCLHDSVLMYIQNKHKEIIATFNTNQRFVIMLIGV